MLKEVIQINDVSIKLELDRVPPSLNHAYYHKKMKNGQLIKIKTKECKEFIDYVHNLFPKTYKEIQNDGKTVLEKEVKPLKGILGISIKICYGDNRKRDLDNSLKIIFDSLEGKAFEDDNQINYIEMRREMGNKPSIKIKIWNLLGTDNAYARCAECGKLFPKDSLIEKYKREGCNILYVGHVCEWCF